MAGKQRKPRRPPAPRPLDDGDGAPAKGAPPSRTPPLALAALLALLTAASYLPALPGGFIWDDKVLLSENAMVHAPDGLARFWFTTQAHDYWPLTATTFWIEWRLWGARPTGYHVTNLALHVVEALLLWAILARLRVPGAFLAALLFALHPMNVESVAWIAQRKNLVALLFLQLAVLLYLRSAAALDRWYWLSAGAFVLAMLGKGSAAVLPLILLLIAWWQHGRLERRDLLRILPFFPLAAALVAVNIWFQTHGVGVIREATLLQRLLGAGAVVWFYLAKALAPLGLAFVYPQWSVDARDPRWWIPPAAALAVTLLLWRSRARVRSLLAAWLFFCIGLLPVMGFADVYFMKYALVADHYAHIALAGVLAPLAAGWSRWARGPQRRLALATAAVLVAALAFLTHRQSGHYRDEETLYTATLATNPACWLCHHNLGILFADSGRGALAIPHYERAVALNPGLSGARVNLGLLLDAAGRSAEALPHLQEAARVDPGSWRVHYDVGIVLAHAGRWSEAVRAYQAALELRPDDATTHNALGSAWQELGDDGRARAEFERALQLDPGNADAHTRLGLSYARARLLPQAIAALGRAAALRPDDATLQYNLGILLTDAARTPEAVAHYENALRLDPAHADAHNNLAIVLAEAGRVDEAVTHYQQAVAARPDFMEARMNLMELQRRHGRAAEAVASAQAALAQARAAGRPEWEPKIQSWLARHSPR
jgi:protein O-mannosyl-transferase